MLHTNREELVLTPWVPPPQAERKATTARPHRPRWNDDGISRLLFEYLDYLRQPLIDVSALPEEFRNSDRRDVKVIEPEPDEVCPFDGPAIERVAWGGDWIATQGDLPWSIAAIACLQYNMFWESMEELSLAENEIDKWSVLKWIFMPAIRKYYVYSQKLGRSRCFEMHESDHPFSFHLCAMRAKMDANEIREGVRRNIPDGLYQAVKKVCTF